METLPGYRFNPTDNELIMHFLFHKVYNKPEYLSVSPIMDFDVYSENQQWRSVFQETGQKEFFFYTVLKKKTEYGSRFDRSAGGCGTWKSQKDKHIYCYPGGDKSQKKHIGSMRSFSFIPNNNNLTDASVVSGRWVMHEYRLNGILLDKQPCSNNNHNHDYVLCRVKKERESQIPMAKARQEVEEPAIAPPLAICPEAEAEQMFFTFDEINGNGWV
ncbi:NAM domain-containing protein [Cephalotus follicularis]|uniref:NAM domain-containing protein n=1 Tax=Cephalotus follicularis TaxID=3775 RepID=A0A1Q3BCR8_CEPFO|nr:NAM domain-containing protein [Cephalotus follicularis]